MEIRVINVTELFTKELLLYSLGDLALQKPFKLIYGMYFIIIFGIFSVPFLLASGITVVRLAIAFIIPALLAWFMGGKKFGGKTFFDWFKTQIKYITSPKVFYDWRVRSEKKLGNFTNNSIISISRRKDFNELIEIKRLKAERYEPTIR